MKNLFKNPYLLILIAVSIVLTGVLLYQQTLISKDKKEVSSFENRIDIKNEEIERLKKELEDTKNKLSYAQTKIRMLKEKRVEPTPHPIEIKVQECMKGTGSITKMSWCVDNSEKDWDLAVQQNLASLKKVLLKEEYPLLLDSQKKWESYRDSQKELIEKTYMNTKALIYLNYASTDEVGITKNRAKYLTWLLHIMKNREPLP